MKKFTFQLNDTDPRPIMHLDWYGIDAMLATGTVLPIWNGSEEELKETGAIVVSEQIKTSTTYGEVAGRLYEIYDFKWGLISFRRLQIVCCPSDYAPSQMMIGISMIQKVAFTIDGSEGTLTLSVPDDAPTTFDLVVEEGEDGRPNVRCEPVEDRS